MTRAARKKVRLQQTGWSPRAKALRFGDFLGVICFREGRWWHIDMTGVRVGPISRREAYLTATSYMNAAEIAAYGAQELERENEIEFAAQDQRTKQEQP